MSRPQGHGVAGRISLVEKSNDPTGNGICDRRSTVLQPTMLFHAPVKCVAGGNGFFNLMMIFTDDTIFWESGRSLLMFQRNVLPPSLGLKSKLSKQAGSSNTHLVGLPFSLEDG
jgi:hypothetical protein